MAIPVFKCEIAFGNVPSDTSPTWTDVSSDLKRFAITRGRQYELNQIDPGTASLTLKNLSRQYDPTYNPSPHWPNVVPLVPIRISATLSSTTYRLFTGYVARWPQNRTGATYAETQVTCVDGFELLTQAILPGTSYVQELGGTRIAHVLNDAGWSTAARSLSAGIFQIPAATIFASDGVVSLQHIQDVQDAEAGMFFMAGNGNATYLDAHALVQSPYTITQATLTDKPSVDGGVGYSDMTPALDKDLIFNDWRGTRDGGATEIASDSTSINEYFRRTQILSPLLSNDTDVSSLMGYYLSQYKQPVLRFGDITVSPGADTVAWTQVLARELGDRLTVRSHPPGAGGPIVDDVHVSRLNLTVDTHAAKAQMIWSTLPADLTSYFILNDSINGVLNTSKLGL